MSVESKREEVLSRIYDRLLDVDGLDAFFNDGGYFLDGKKVAKQHPITQLIATLENASDADEDARLKSEELALKERDLALKEQELGIKEQEFSLKDAQVLTENANKDIDRRHEFKMELVRLAITTGATIITTAVWGALFTHEMRATRTFELDGTEVSAAGRWLKNSFPKPKVF